MADRTEVNETAEKLTHKNKADRNLKLKSTLLLYKFYALIFAVDFRFSLCYPKTAEKAKMAQSQMLGYEKRKKVKINSKKMKSRSKSK